MARANKGSAHENHKSRMNATAQAHDLSWVVGGVRTHGRQQFKDWASK